MADDPGVVAARTLADLVPRLGRLIAGALETGLDVPLSLRQYRLLERLAEGPFRTTELAANADVSQPTASAALAKLEGQGLVSRSPDPGDRRAHLITLTGEGRAMLDRARALVLQRLLLVTGEVTAEQATALAALRPVLDAGVDHARDVLRRERAPGIGSAG